nr:MAG TPA: hypothetical protein [Caudoviricetes sp.]
MILCKNHCLRHHIYLHIYDIKDIDIGYLLTKISSFVRMFFSFFSFFFWFFSFFFVFLFKALALTKNFFRSKNFKELGLKKKPKNY